MAVIGFTTSPSILNGTIKLFLAIIQTVEIIQTIAIILDKNNNQTIATSPTIALTYEKIPFNFTLHNHQSTVRAK
ncbi:hypothetical protein ATK78_2802 [Pedobacter metabolipauper]|uniref:Uncharacterized protein n=1 Tax=Pedobacter metabolipauper TaxID=425513 RepID=A0A4R6STN7_9SPHI|nr:hypothetical protein ATK78_2802 [Pedobacter metabolipauper]